MFRRLRILILLLVLATVAHSAWLARSRAAEWKSSLQVAVYPIAGDGSPATAETLARLREEQFEPIERFLEREARRHGIATLRPVDVSLAPVVSAKPPDPPGARGVLDTVLWSLHLRWWAWRHDETAGPKPPTVCHHLAAAHRPRCSCGWSAPSQLSSRRSSARCWTG